MCNFNHHEPKAPTAKQKAESECAFGHEAGAKKDEVLTQFYPLPDDQQGQGRRRADSWRRELTS